MPLFTGTSGDDRLNGSSEDDLMTGGAGNDFLNGWQGNDTLDWGSGSENTMHGGYGDDVYLIADGGGHIYDLGGGDVLVLPFASTAVDAANLSVRTTAVYLPDASITEAAQLSGALLNDNTVSLAAQSVEVFRFQDGVEWSLAELQAAVAPVDDFADDATTTGQLALGAPAIGDIEVALDVDWFAVTLEAGTLYQFDLEARTSDVGALQRTHLKGVYDGSGTKIFGSGDRGSGAGGNSVDWLEVSDDGTYHVAVGGSFTSTGTYTLTLSELTDDFAASTDTTGVLTLDAPVTGSIDYFDDVDWFAIELQAGGLYQFDLEGTATGKGTLEDPDLDGIHDPSGNKIRSTHDSDSGEGDNSRSWFTALEDGVYYVTARTFRDSTGTYTLSVQELEDDFAATTATTGRVMVGGQVTGALDVPNDHDWFAVDLTADVPYRVDMLGQSFGGGDLNYPRLSPMRDANGDAVEFAQFIREQGGRATNAFSVEETGTYYIAANGHRGSTYTIEVSEMTEIVGTAGNDWLHMPDNWSSDLLGVQGGDGIDMMSFAGLDGPVYAHTGLGQASSSFASSPFDMVMGGIENVTGTSYGDVFNGSERAEVFRGLGGRDVFYAAHAGADHYDGGTGADTLTYVQAGEGVSVSLLRGRGFAGDALRDTITNVEYLNGSRHDDFLWGDHGNNRIEGLQGDDVIIGNGGNDYILAGSGTDTIVFSGNQADYTITRDGIRTDVIDSVMGRDGHDVIGHAEILRFADGDLML